MTARARPRRAARWSRFKRRMYATPWRDQQRANWKRLRRVAAILALLAVVAVLAT